LYSISNADIVFCIIESFFDPDIPNKKGWVRLEAYLVEAAELFSTLGFSGV